MAALRPVRNPPVPPIYDLVAPLALSMPDDPAEPTLLAATDAVVLFSVVVQGGTLGSVVRRTVRAG